VGCDQEEKRGDFVSLVITQGRETAQTVAVQDSEGVHDCKIISATAGQCCALKKVPIPEHPSH
jgi:hypothetical protein